MSNTQAGQEQDTAPGKTVPVYEHIDALAVAFAWVKEAESHPATTAAQVAQLWVSLAQALETRQLRRELGARDGEWVAREARWQDVAAAWLDVAEARETAGDAAATARASAAYWQRQYADLLTEREGEPE